MESSSAWFVWTRDLTTASRDAETRGFNSLATIVDPTAVVARSTTLGVGTYVNAGAVIGGAAKIVCIRGSLTPQ